MNVESIIQAAIKRLRIENYAVREEIYSISQLHKNAAPYRRFINFDPDEIVIPYKYRFTSTLALYTAGVAPVDFVLRSASNTQRIAGNVFLEGDLTVAPTDGLIGTLNHVSVHREFLTIEYVDSSSWIYTYSGGGDVHAIILKILNKN